MYYAVCISEDATLPNSLCLAFAHLSNEYDYEMNPKRIKSSGGAIWWYPLSAGTDSQTTPRSSKIHEDGGSSWKISGISLEAIRIIFPQTELPYIYDRPISE